MTETGLSQELEKLKQANLKKSLNNITHNLWYNLYGSETSQFRPYIFRITPLTSARINIFAEKLTTDMKGGHQSKAYCARFYKSSVNMF